MSGEIYQKIKAVMGDVPQISKSHRHQQGWEYRGVEDFLAAFRPALHRNGLFLLPEVVSLETGTRVTDPKGDKPGAQMHYVIATVAYTLIADDGSSVRSVVIGESWDNSDNASTKAMNDALTTFLTQVFCVPAGEAKAGQQNRTVDSNNKPQAQSRTTPNQASQPASNVLPIEAKKLTSEEMQKRAEQIVKESRVTCEGSKCVVRANEKISYDVTRQDGKLTCQCERFGAHKDCEHIRAVRLHYSTPKPDGKTEVSMLIADVRQAGCSQETIDALLAKLCDGLFDPTQMDDAQIQKAKRALQFKLEELNAQRKAA